jgi:hypothetical protein
MKRIPVTSGLLLCEQVIVEEETRNVTLVNCFTARRAARFPAEDVPFVAFALLSDGQGDILLQVKVHRLDIMDETYVIGRTCRFSSPSQVVRCTVRIRDCFFPAPGEYQVSLLASGTVLAQTKLRLTEIEGSS